MRLEKGDSVSLTEGRNDGTCDAVGHADCEDTHGPGVLQAKLELIGLALWTQTQRGFFKLKLNKIHAHVKKKKKKRR